MITAFLKKTGTIKYIVWSKMIRNYHCISEEKLQKIRCQCYFVAYLFLTNTVTFSPIAQTAHPYGPIVQKLLREPLLNFETNKKRRKLETRLIVILHFYHFQLSSFVLDAGLPSLHPFLSDCLRKFLLRPSRQDGVAGLFGFLV